LGAGVRYNGISYAGHGQPLVVSAKYVVGDCGDPLRNEELAACSHITNIGDKIYVGSCFHAVRVFLWRTGGAPSASVSYNG